jgi:hypothetical protein
MYLARQLHKGQTRYFIRESYADGAIYRSRELLALGPDPSRHICYPGGNAFYIDERLEERLQAKGASDASDGLETLLWPFVKPDLRRKLRYFHNRRTGSAKGFKNPGLNAAVDDKTIHTFDKRRLLYLRTGRLRQGSLNRIPYRMLKVLANKSRDEREQLFLQSEDTLPPREFKKYIYVIFDLQRHFYDHWAQSRPQQLNQAELDQVFIDTLCRLDGDRRFWQGFGDSGMPPNSGLHPYLARYVIMYFDFDFAYENATQAYIRQFIRNHRFYRPKPSQPTLSMEEVAALFDVPAAELATLDRRRLSRLFRRRALKLHPDQGGDHEQFVRLIAAYQALMARKKYGP